MKNHIVSKALKPAIAVLMAATLIVGCGKEAETPAEEEAVEEITDEVAPEAVAEEEEEDVSGLSHLTGLPVSEDVYNKRPIACMIENTKECLPQYRLNSAGVVYECPVEGSYTRLMAVFDDVTGYDQIGNVRSCRPYYAYIAREYDAVYVHFGQSIHGEQLLKTGIVQHINGVGPEGGIAFYRTDEHAAPHNAYTSDECIQEGLDFHGYSLDLPEDYENHFKFVSKDNENTLSDGEDCQVIVPYYFYNHPWYEYDPETKEYKRFQFGDAQIDNVDGSQCTAVNLIFQNVDSSLYEQTQYLNIPLVGSGKGTFFTRGKMVPITWKKDSDTSITHYYYENGEEIQLNPGRTWVSLMQNDYVDKNEYYATVEEYKN
ncbi:MAG: DUF3048 domain-containing protein [Lachnospiraceae bacterium]|nr:DUF3048 domain-containing protein [Lachnospiraceae bacterium]